MNANEVIANRALETLGHPRGFYDVIHPLDHVNLGQSTNDVYPTAVRLALVTSLRRLGDSLRALATAFAEKAAEFGDALKMGRTQLQDAVPMTLGQEFTTYAVMIEEDRLRLGEAAALLLESNLGGTAIGTGINGHPRYAELACAYLAGISGEPVPRLGVGFGVLAVARRNAGPSEAVELARLVARRAGSGVVSFVLAGDEARYPPEPFAKAFAIARDAGLIPAPHAGELAGPASVRAALDALGARRIAHGVRAVEDPALVTRLAAEGVVLDICPTSHAALGAVESLTAQLWPLLLQAGVRGTINADDPLLFGPGLLEEYETVRTAFALTDHQLAAVARTSVESSGAPRDLVDDAVKRIDA